jgi:alpha(1,3/1,4) fucosyltransferase
VSGISKWFGVTQAKKTQRTRRSHNVNKTATPTPARKIWWTGENVRPPVSCNFDHTISFDQDSYGGLNTYFPLFWIDLLFPTREALKRVGLDVIEVESLTRPRKDSTLGKKGFVCAFLSNPEPTRIRAIQELRKYGEVDVYGPYTGKPVASKAEIAKGYKFMLAFENDLYPGYITEKILDAYLCETIPLYWGLFGSEDNINRNSIINLADFESLRDFCEYVGTLSQDTVSRIFQEPLLRKVPSRQVFIDALLGTDSSEGKQIYS